MIPDGTVKPPNQATPLNDLLKAVASEAPEMYTPLPYVKERMLDVVPESINFGKVLNSFEPDLNPTTPPSPPKRNQPLL